MPTWWVRAYERQLSSAAAANATIDPAQSVILPSLTEIELDALSILINQCQQQMLAGKSPLSLHKSWHDKHVASHKKADLFAFSRMFSLLGGVRLLVADREDKARTVPLFSRELWRRMDGDGVVQLDPTDIGAMLVLGYGEPYLCRMAHSTAGALDTLLEGHSPLSLWRAPWLDFKGTEKLVLLRMERAMQWQLSYLTLSGVFEGDFEELTAGIVSDRVLARADCPIDTKFAALEKVGKKLADHGYLDWDWDSSEFLAFSGYGQSLVWKIMDSRGQQEDHRSYRTKSAAYLFEHLFLRHLDGILLALFGIRWRDDPSYQELRGMIDVLLDGPILEDIEVLTILKGNRLLVNGALFIEWLIRLVPEQPLSLPEELVGSEVITLLRSVTKDNIVAKFREFSELIADDPILLDELKTDPRLTCALPEPSAQPEPSPVPPRAAAVSSHPAHRKKAANTADNQGKSKQAQSKQARPEQARPEQAEPTPARPEPPEHKPAPAAQAPAAQAQVTSQKTAAAKHLHQLKAANPRGYQQLKKRYISSLGATEAKAIMDMQKILTAHHFDTQIKQSLVLYLVANPSEWQAPGPEQRVADKQRSAEAILKSLLS